MYKILLQCVVMVMIGSSRGVSAEPDSRIGAVVNVFREFADPDQALKRAYDLAQKLISGLQFKALQSEIQAYGGRELYATESAGCSRMLVVRDVFGSRNGLKNNLECDINYNHKTGEVYQIRPILMGVIEKPIHADKAVGLFAKGAVAARALSLDILKAEVVKQPFLAAVEVSYGAIGWDFNPIHGHGYQVVIEFVSDVSESSKRSSVSFRLAAFDSVDTPDVEGEVSPFPGTKLLSFPGFDTLQGGGHESVFISVGESRGVSSEMKMRQP